MAKTIMDSIVLQKRDLELLEGLFESRVMTAAHVATLYFGGNAGATKQRLHKLKSAGLIAERPRRPSEPAVLYLARKAFGILRDDGVLAKYPDIGLTSFERRADVKDATIRHELEVMDVKAAFHGAIRHAPSFSIAYFSTWPLLHEFEVTPPGMSGRNVIVRPDGFVRIHEAEPDGSVSEHTPFFLEVDRSSERQEILVSKAYCYLEYYRSGSFAVRQGGSRSAHKEFPFRVLIVCKSAERRNNAAERLLSGNPSIPTMAHLSTLAEVTNDPLGAVWIRPVDYGAATKGTPFAAALPIHEYRSLPERERFVEERINKIRLLAG